MAFDFKKEYKELYAPKRKPEIIEVPRAGYVAVRGKGDPNEENGCENDFSNSRLHHEIYLSDARRVAPEKWRTIIRHPIKRA